MFQTLHLKSGSQLIGVGSTTYLFLTYKAGDFTFDYITAKTFSKFIYALQSAGLNFGPFL